MNKKDLPAMYSIVFWCLLVILLFIWLYYITTVTLACSRLSDSGEDPKEKRHAKSWRGVA